MRKFDVLFILVPFKEREVNNPGQRKLIAVDKIKFFACPVLAAPAKSANLRGSPATKKQASPSASFSWLRSASVRSGPIFFAIGPAP